jgi:EmrB/QacA subfamily drug resistance transporter
MSLAVEPRSATAPPHPRRWAALAVLCLSLYLVVMDGTIVNVALPTFVRELGASTTQLQWIVDAYLLVFTGLLLAGGALGDRFGRSRMLLLGMGAFAGTSVLAAVADGPGQLIAVRGLMGIGAALVFPATLAIITNLFTDPRERATAIAIWTAMTGVAVATGPIVGGWLLEHFWWGSVFLVNLPVAAVALLAGWALVPDSRDEAAPPLDLGGVATSMLGVSGIVFGIIEGPHAGWTDPLTLAAFAAGAVGLLAFVRIESRHPHPMLPVRLFRNPRFTAASLSVAAAFFALFGFIFLITQFFQLVLGYRPLEAGIRTLPFALATAPVSLAAAWLAARFGTKRVVAAGLALMSVGFAWVAGVSLDTAYIELVGQMVLLCAGLGLVSAPATESIMGAVPPDQAGVGSAVNDTTRELGGTLGVAVVGSVFASVYADRVTVALAGTPVPVEAAAAVRESVGAALVVSEQLPGPAGAALVAVAQQAFVDGLGVACLVVAVVAAIGAIGALRFLPARAEEQGDAVIAAAPSDPVHAPLHRAVHGVDLVADLAVEPR